MGEVKPYIPDSLASPLVGVAKRHSALADVMKQGAAAVGNLIQQQGEYNKVVAGGLNMAYNVGQQQMQGEAKFAEGAASLYKNAEGIVPGVASREAGMVDSATNTIANTVGNLAYAFGNAWQKNQNAQQRQANQIQAANIQTAGYDYAGQMNDAFDDAKLQNIDTPENIVSDMNNTMNKAASTMLADPKFANDEAAQAQLQSHIAQTQNKLRGQATDWQFNRSKDIQGETINKAVSDSVNRVSGLTGDVAKKVRDYNAEIGNTENLIKNMAAPMLNGKKTPLLGYAYTDQKSAELKRSASNAFWHNLANDLPDDPEQQLNYAEAIKGLLSQSDVPASKGGIDIPLDSKDKQSLITMYHRTAQQAATGLENSLGVAVQRHNLATRQFKLYAQNNSENPAIQQGMLNFVEQQSQKLRIQGDNVAKSTWPDSVKNEYMKSLNTQQTQLDNLASAAHANLQSIDDRAAADKRQEISDQKALEREAQRDQKQAEREDKADVAKKLLEGKIEFQKGQVGLMTDIYELNKDPQKNMKAIQQKSMELNAYMMKGADMNFTTYEHAFNVNKVGLQAADAAVKHQADAPNIFGNIVPSWARLPFSQTKTEKDALKAQRQQASVQTVRNGANALFGSMQATQKAAEVLTPQQHQFFEEQMMATEAARLSQNPPRPFTQTERDAFAKKLTIFAQKEFPGTGHPALIKQAAKRDTRMDVAKPATPSHAKKHHGPANNYMVPPPPPTPYIPSSGSNLFELGGDN